MAFIVKCYRMKVIELFISYHDLKMEQSRDLDYKITTAIDAIKDAFKVCRHRVALAFSAGKDSTVLWHLIRTHFPELATRMAIIYGNTGVEYSECVRFARQLANEWGNGNFYEAVPGRTVAVGLKYRAQQEVLQYLISGGKRAFARWVNRFIYKKYSWEENDRWGEAQENQLGAWILGEAWGWLSTGR